MENIIEIDQGDGRLLLWGDMMFPGSGYGRPRHYKINN